MQQLCSTISITEESNHVRIWLCMYQRWHFARLLALNWNLVCWYGWSSLFEITMTCTCLRNDRTTHIRRQQSCSEHGSDLPPCPTPAPDTTHENSCQEGLLKDFINTSSLLCWKKNKTNPCTGSRNEFLQKRPLRASSLFLPKIRVWALCARY